MNPGKLYLALQVADLNRSLAFYRQLGFEPDPQEGGIEQKWLLLRCNDTTIALFQDMFPRDMLVFESDHVRELYRDLQAKGLPIDVAVNLEGDSGACHFALLDPDGHPLLFDQREKKSS